jgi:hypothetical protein
MWAGLLFWLAEARRSPSALVLSALAALLATLASGILLLLPGLLLAATLLAALVSGILMLLARLLLATALLLSALAALLVLLAGLLLLAALALLIILVHASYSCGRSPAYGGNGSRKSLFRRVTICASWFDRPLVLSSGVPRARAIVCESVITRSDDQLAGMPRHPPGAP